jgi:hypothetical protein
MAAAAGVAAGAAATAAGAPAHAAAPSPIPAVVYAAAAPPRVAASYVPAPAPVAATHTPAPAAGSYAPFPVTGNSSAGSAPLTDPLGAVILSLVEGKGQLSGLELKRLDVFRPDMIEVAAEAVDLPPKLAHDEQVLLRLAQIKLYAATLDLRAKWRPMDEGERRRVR